ncbi:MAG TPA: glucosamine-6-phosphate isomerase [Prolixibacteraceae bacterium]|nr:glucosamine-6-phosphate isomerase [Prolixibacteraceae bacterium]HRV90200.1 glucosamine-6-phosphate isomerase [Prolixibacteraceae bacterium]
MRNFTRVEEAFYLESGSQEMTTPATYLIVDNFPKLGLLSALSFLEWAGDHPEGVISLPTSKTAQHFLRNTRLLLEKWNDREGVDIREKYGLGGVSRPDLRGLRFVQAGEFYPIHSAQHNSLWNYAWNYYIRDFGLDPKKALLINSDEIPLAGGKNYTEVFPDLKIDLTLRFREARNHLEKLQQQSVFMIDDWCRDYEARIREVGGIGFFLGSIGPDGHIAFNTRGTSHYSPTRLTETNFETQAVTAGDLGGIEVSRNRLVITVGLGTLAVNPQAKAIVYAAGEAIAEVIRDSVESLPNTMYPATALQKLENARFYLTRGAAVKLRDSIRAYYCGSPWDHRKTEKAVIDLCKKVNKFGPKLTLDDLRADEFCAMIPGLNEQTVQSVIDSILVKMRKGMQKETHQIYYHTGPHHDDIMLGIMPMTNRQSREATNEMHFSVLTSGFTAVTNRFMRDLLGDTLDLIGRGKIEMIHYPDFFEKGYQYKWDKDVYHYLDNIAAMDEEGKRRGVCHRLVRAMVSIWGMKNGEELVEVIRETIALLEKSYDGAKNPPNVQKLKGMIREFEEELVWAHYGVSVKNVHHLRLGFYQGDVFGAGPDRTRDVLPILEDFRKYKPTVISLAMDPEGSGPDTHYKVLQAIAAAVAEWRKEADLSHLRIIGYRNVWFRYNPSDVEVIVPVSMNSLAVLDKSFTDCYLTQVNASFPSYQLDGKFSELTQKIWMEQHKQIQFLLGKNFYYENESPLLRAAHGLIYVRELNVQEFLTEASKLGKSVEGLF